MTMFAPSAREALRGGEADAARAAGDDGGAAGEALGEIHGCPVWGSRRVARGAAHQRVAKKTFLVSVKCSGGVGAELAAEAALLHAAERGRVAHARVRVDAEVAGLHAARDPDAAAEVVGPDRPAQAVDRVVGERDRVGLVVERQHADDRAEDLLRRDAVGAGCRQQHGRAASRTRGPRAPIRGRRRSRAVEECPAPMSRCAAETSGPISVDLVAGLPDLERLDGGLEQLEEPVEHRPLDEDAAAGAAVLAGVVEHRARRRRGRPLEVGVGEDDVGALAAELERDRLDQRGAAGGDLLADLGRSGEDDLAHVRVRDEPLPHDRAAAGQHLEEALGQPRLERRARRDGSR